MKIPELLEEYLESTEQYSEEMSAAELFEEASWLLSMNRMGEYDGTPEQIRQLKAFRTRISNKMIRR